MYFHCAIAGTRKGMTARLRRAGATGDFWRRDILIAGKSGRQLEQFARVRRRYFYISLDIPGLVCSTS